MNDRAAFLAAIREAPDDDAPRLIYADWLDENGEAERAEFVRVQCELARLDIKLRGQQFGCGGKHSHDGFAGQIIHGILHESDPRWPHHHHDDRCVDPRDSLRRREQELFHELSDYFSRFGDYVFGAITVKDFLDREPSYTVVRRGFVHAITCRHDDWVGRECERCSLPNTRPHEIMQPFPFCEICHGTGRVNAYGPLIVRADGCVIERVTFSDISIGPAGAFSTRVHHVWDVLRLGDLRSTSPIGKMIRQEFDSEAAALDALSDAAIRFAWKY